MTGDTLEAAARIVQLALTPVFLLSGIAALLNVFASRLGRVADQADTLAGQPDDLTRHARLRILRWRSIALDWAVVLAALAGTLTCGAVLVLFLGEVRGSSAAVGLFLLFGGAIVLTMGALVAFVVEMLLAARGVRRLVIDPARAVSGQWYRKKRAVYYKVCMHVSKIAQAGSITAASNGELELRLKLVVDWDRTRTHRSRPQGRLLRRRESRSPSRRMRRLVLAHTVLPKVGFCQGSRQHA